MSQVPTELETVAKQWSAGRRARHWSEVLIARGIQKTSGDGLEAWARLLYYYFLLDSGRFDEALIEIQKAYGIAQRYNWKGHDFPHTVALEFAYMSARMGAFIEVAWGVYDSVPGDLDALQLLRLRALAALRLASDEDGVEECLDDAENLLSRSKLRDRDNMQAEADWLHDLRRAYFGKPS